ncbi:methionyl-tRNA synthetase [[Emmonsia] crescens]|uniref:Methionyl-tRNA synthetase n=1 Tax=[Emmonsia] crescens TaxID=73230 RepID=A0A0G2IEL8_9EURO|nr:methionyl-tRNA synthetase [Emmonsia crescens UAMH 3008]
MSLDGVKNIVLERLQKLQHHPPKSNSLDNQQTFIKKPQVLSGKGGVGKSSVTLQLALALTLHGRSVGILDVDLTGPSIPRLVGKEDAKITQAPGGWVPVLVHPASVASSSTQPPTSQPVPAPQPQSQPQPQQGTTTSRGSLRCMSLGFLLRDRGDAVIWRGPKKTAMIRQFLTDVLWGETDYLLIDTPPGTSDEHIALAEQLLTLASTTRAGSTTNQDSTSTQQPQQQPKKKPLLAGAVLVTTPQAISTADVRKELNFCAKTCIPVIGVVENMSGYSCPCCGEVSNVFSSGGGRIMAEEMGVRFLGAVPIDVGFGEMVEGVRGSGEGVVNAGEGEDLLVERYQKCWSRPLFEAFASTVIEEAEGRR